MAFGDTTVFGAIALVAIVTAAIVVGTTSMAPATDEITLPPAKREACSFANRYCVELGRAETVGPRSFPTMSIFYLRDGKKTEVGKTKLGYPGGPRFIFILDDGRVVLIDEWLRRADTAYAIEIFNEKGKSLKKYSLGDVIAITGENRETILAAAEVGPWLVAPPKFNHNEARISLMVGSLVLSLDLTGSIPILSRLNL